MFDKHTGDGRDERSGVRLSGDFTRFGRGRIHASTLTDCDYASRSRRTSPSVPIVHHQDLPALDLENPRRISTACGSAVPLRRTCYILVLKGDMLHS